MSDEKQRLEFEPSEARELLRKVIAEGGGSEEWPEIAAFLERASQPPGESHLAFLLFHVLDELEKYQDFTRQEVATHLRSELQRLGLTKKSGL